MAPGSLEQIKQIEDRKKVVAAIYLNSMTGNKASASGETREKHSRRRQSDGDQQESGPVISGGINRSQIYGAEKSTKIVPIQKFRNDYISKRNGRSSQYSQGPEERGDPYQQKESLARQQ